ncbi:hypothetical protein KFV02_01710 [Desulfohalobiaceae bacterium Ax17]|uniref:CheR family methyltransferase n=1 Tax=Desulfovulcanus ferrireducens TaxID=2831190 RepID=UPI00207BB4C9|nr:CheR family methyltransferase [Desulfovulcanus ferrireducens]MBT8762648.1 hypothetical protein [Desulfovulcanus ferrireducens]
MKESEWVHFLQWALPRLRMRWAGFRKVRKQVCKRIRRRIEELQLEGVISYRAYLESHPEEWTILEVLCRVTITRFYRDKRTFAFLEQEVLPELARQTLARGEDTLRMWSAGCASGEEPYTLALMWELSLRPLFPGLTVRILATDLDAVLIERAAQACYQARSLKELPDTWRDIAFVQKKGIYCLRPEYKANVKFLCHDVRTMVPGGPFHLVLCRNLVFTYFDTGLQLETWERIWESIYPGGCLVLGSHESLPEGAHGFMLWSRMFGIYMKCW